MKYVIKIVCIMLGGFMLGFFFMSLVGCDYIQPGVEKSKTEKKQLKQLERQTVALERIATAVEGGR